MLRRSHERRYCTQAKIKIWQTFFPADDDQADESRQGQRSFAALLGFDEVRIPPAGLLSRSDVAGDAFTYVHRGAVAQRNASGSYEALAGDFQRMASREPRAEVNASSTDWAHLFRIRLACIPLGYNESPLVSQQQRFTAAQRRNTLCLVASPDGALGSLVLRSDARIYSSVVDVGRHIVYSLEPGRTTWLHIVYGRATLDSAFELAQGDGIGISDAPSLSVTADEDSEILLIDMGPAPASSKLTRSHRPI